MEPSHVLAAMGVPRERALGARAAVARSRDRPSADVDRALEVIPAAVAQLRQVVPCRCWSPCRAASTRRSRPRCSSSRARRRRRHDEAVGRRVRLAAAARWPTSTTPAASRSSSASTTTSSTSATTSMRDVVGPYVAAHAAGRTPNPCIECNRHLKFDRLLDRADRLGFDCVATGHHARVGSRRDGRDAAAPRRRSRARTSRTCCTCSASASSQRVLLPVGELTKDEVRQRADALGLRTAAKPDSQDVCFITSAGGRREFLGDRMPLHPGRVVDTEGRDVGAVDAVELVTIGQRRGLGAVGWSSVRTRRRRRRTRGGDRRPRRRPAHR